MSVDARDLDSAEYESGEYERTLDKQRDKIEHLTRALENSRAIGIAIGILVERYKIAPGEAFPMLVQVSQDTNRKVWDISEELLYTGALPQK